MSAKQILVLGGGFAGLWSAIGQVAALQIAPYDFPWRERGGM